MDRNELAYTKLWRPLNKRFSIGKKPSVWMTLRSILDSANDKKYLPEGWDIRNDILYFIWPKMSEYVYLRSGSLSKPPLLDNDFYMEIGVDLFPEKGSPPTTTLWKVPVNGRLDAELVYLALAIKKGTRLADLLDIETDGLVKEVKKIYSVEAYQESGQLYGKTSEDLEEERSTVDLKRFELLSDPSD